MRRTSITARGDDQHQASTQGARTRKVLGKVLMVLAMCALFATMTPDTASANSEIFHVKRTRTFDTCRYTAKAAQTTNYSYGAGYRPQYECVGQAVKVKFGYTASNGRRYYTPYKHSQYWAQQTRYNTTPRYATACIHGPNIGRWGCQTVWA